ILLRQKQKKLIMLPSETMIWQPEFTDKTLSRKPGAVHGDGKQFSCSRDFAASTGLVPRQYSTGGKSTLLGISKR
ncbi:transposase, partial [Escherichia coli]